MCDGISQCGSSIVLLNKQYFIASTHYIAIYTRVNGRTNFSSKITTSLYILLQLLSVSIFEKNDISLAFQPSRQIEDNEDDPKQLSL
jgi:hypothetical protein